MGLLYSREIPITDKISVFIPTVGEILFSEPKGEESYLSAVSLFTAMPIDMMLQLDDIGIDYESINAFDLFLMMYSGMVASGETIDTRLLLGDLDLSNFELAVNDETGAPALIERDKDIIIDRRVFNQIADALRMINNIEKNRRKAANKETKEYMLERARIKRKRAVHKPFESCLEPLIIAMVNTEQYKYDYEGTLELSIYQFYQSVKQIIHKVEYNNRMIGVYSGTVSSKSLQESDFNWLTHK